METVDGKMCDVCEEPFPAAETVRFGHRDRSYEVDLCAPHVTKLEKVLQQFVDGGRPVS